MSLSRTELNKLRDEERGPASYLYWLTLALPLTLLTGPFALLLLIVYPILVLMGFLNRHAFVRWHTGQWTLLTIAAIGVTMVSAAIGVTMVSLLSLAVCAVPLWWLASLYGAWEARGGQCLLWKLFGSEAPLPRPWTRPAATASAPATTPSPSPTHREEEERYARLWARGKVLAADPTQRAEAVSLLLRVFREAPPHWRADAMTELKKLNEVEVF